MWTYMLSHAHLNRASIQSLEGRTARIKSGIIDQEEGADALRMDLCRLMLVVEAMKRVLVSRKLMTEREFQETILSLDLEDGVQDGLRTQKKVPRMTCDQCGRRNRKRSYCYFCGQPLHVLGGVELKRRDCPKCRKRNAPRAVTCLYCGAGLVRKRGKK